MFLNVYFNLEQCISFNHFNRNFNLTHILKIFTKTFLPWPKISLSLGGGYLRLKLTLEYTMW